MRTVDLRLGPRPIGLAERLEYSWAVRVYEAHFDDSHDDIACDDLCDVREDLRQATEDCFASTWHRKNRWWRIAAFTERLTLVKR